MIKVLKILLDNEIEIWQNDLFSKKFDYKSNPLRFIIIHDSWSNTKHLNIERALTEVFGDYFIKMDYVYDESSLKIYFKSDAA